MADDESRSRKRGKIGPPIARRSAGLENTGFTSEAEKFTYMHDESPVDRVMREHRERVEAAQAARDTDKSFVAAALQQIAAQVGQAIADGMGLALGSQQPYPQQAGLDSTGRRFVMNAFGEGRSGFGPYVMISVEIIPAGSEFADPSKMHYSVSGSIAIRRQAGASVGRKRSLRIQANINGDGRPGVVAEELSEQIVQVLREDLES